MKGCQPISLSSSFRQEYLNRLYSLTSPSSSGAYMVQTDPAYEPISYDFSSIAAVNNNPKFAVKIVFYQSVGVPANIASGNDRFDNLTVDGVHL